MSRATQMFTSPAPSASATTTNLEGYPAFERPLREQYLQTLLTNSLGNSYYATDKELVTESEAIHRAMIAEDPVFAAKGIVYARNHGFMRTQPLFALSLLSGSSLLSTETFAQTFFETVRTPNDLGDFTAMLHAQGRGAGGRRVKTAAGRWLVERLNPYWTVKYGADKGAGGFSLRDMLQLYHPRAGRKLPLFDYIMAREGTEVSLTELPQIGWFERLKKLASTERDEAAMLTCVADGRLPHEVVTPFAGASKAMWVAMAKQMPIFALLRNLASLERHGALPEVRDYVISKLTDERVIQKSMIFPFRFMEAARHVSDPRVKDALRDAVDLSLANVPEVPGNVAVLLDISGSMADTVGGRAGGPTRLDVAALFGVTLVRKAPEGKLVLFDTRAGEFAVSRRDSVLTQAERIKPQGGTNTSTSVMFLHHTKFRADTIVLITDEQQNAGDPFVDVMARYRRELAPAAKLFVLNVAPYTKGQIVSSSMPNTWFLYGWSDQALRYISMAACGWGGVVEVVGRGGAAEPVSESEEG